MLSMIFNSSSLGVMRSRLLLFYYETWNWDNWNLFSWSLAFLLKVEVNLKKKVDFMKVLLLKLRLNLRSQTKRYWFYQGFLNFGLIFLGHFYCHQENDAKKNWSHYLEKIFFCYTNSHIDEINLFLLLTLNVFTYKDHLVILMLVFEKEILRIQNHQALPECDEVNSDFVNYAIEI